MDTTTRLNFIEKVTLKTKNNELDWSMISDAFNIRPLSNSSFISERLHLNYSCKAPYKTGNLLLLVTSSPLDIVNPPDGCSFSLRMQDDKSVFAIEITNSQADPVDAIALLRLYNLIIMESSSASRLIDDFLNS